MSEPEQPQIYLISPPEFDLSTFPDTLARLLDVAPVACMRLALSTQDEDRLSRAADAVREVTHARDIALVIDSHVMLAERLGLDGVHLTDGGRRVAATRKTLGDDAIVGAFCGTSRHDGMSAGEAGADYVSFGPVGANALGDGTQAPMDLFAWWSEMIEVPIVAEGALDLSTAKALAPISDFLMLGPEIWDAEDAAQNLSAYVQVLSDAP